MNRLHLSSRIVREFERLLFDTIRDEHSGSSIAFHAVEIIAQRLRNSEKFKHEKYIQSMKFSYHWWERFQQRHAIRSPMALTENSTFAKASTMSNLMTKIEKGMCDLTEDGIDNDSVLETGDIAIDELAENATNHEAATFVAQVENRKRTLGLVRVAVERSTHFTNVRKTSLLDAIREAEKKTKQIVGQTQNALELHDGNQIQNVLETTIDAVECDIRQTMTVGETVIATDEVCRSDSRHAMTEIVGQYEQYKQFQRECANRVRKQGEAIRKKLQAAMSNIRKDGTGGAREIVKMLNAGKDEFFRGEPNEFDKIFMLNQSDDPNPTFPSSSQSVGFNNHRLLEVADGDTNIGQERYYPLSSEPAIVEMKEEDDFSSDCVKIENLD